MDAQPDVKESTDLPRWVKLVLSEFGGKRMQSGCWLRGAQVLQRITAIPSYHAQDADAPIGPLTRVKCFGIRERTSRPRPAAGLFAARLVSRTGSLHTSELKYSPQFYEL